MNNPHKNLKRKKCILFAITVLFSIFSLTACGNRPTPKERVLAVFEEQKETILQRIEGYHTDGTVEWDDLEGVLYVYDHAAWNDGILQFECIAEGIMTSSFQAGFYYSPDDVPAIVGWISGPSQELVEDGEGYSWDDGSDNIYYTERICENFYYYQESN